MAGAAPPLGGRHQPPAASSIADACVRRPLGASAWAVRQSSDETLQFRVDDEVHHFERHDSDQALRAHHERLGQVTAILKMNLDPH